MPVQRWSALFRWTGSHRHGDDAVEVGRPGAVLDRGSFAVEVHPPARCAGREQEARHVEGPFHAAGDFPRVGFVFDARDLEAGRDPLGDAIGEVGVAELGEGVVAHVELAFGVVGVAGDREVPRQVQARALDALFFEFREQFFEVRATNVDGFLFAGDVVPVVAEADGRFQRFVCCVREVAQRHDVAVPRGEVDRRMDLQHGVGGVRGVRVDLNPDRPAFLGHGVDHDHRRVGVLVLADVIDRHGLARVHVGSSVDARCLHEDHRPGAEAIRSVVGRGFDVGAVHVRGHGFVAQVHPPAGLAGRVFDGVVVIRERQHADTGARVRR